MFKKNRGEKELHWREILNRQIGSGLSIRRFCASEGVSEPSFYAWRRRLWERNSVTRPRKASRRNDGDGRDQGQLFVPLQLINAAPALEIIHPLGYRIQVTGDVDPVALRHVIETLDERGVR
jgi:hypothetical protein